MRASLQASLEAFVEASSFARGRVARRAVGRALRVVAFALLGLALFVLAAPGCGRSSLEPESLGLGGGKAPGACGPTTCPTGCCDAAGVCQPGSALDACGALGGQCSDCVASGFSLCTESGVCGREDPSCSARTCTGCCAVDGGRLRCLSGIAPTACGRTGAECADCAATGRACDTVNRVCGSTRCDSTNCTGCCVGDTCLPGTARSACGAKGAQCASCGTGQCGVLAGGAGGQCTGGACGPHNCKGCCSGDRCFDGNGSSACGTGGGLCDACGPSERCELGPAGNQCVPVLTTCGPENCDGCCVGNQCRPGNSTVACGVNGAACTSCGSNATCSAAGTCVPTGDCDATTCPSGCCVGDICAVGTQATACGTGGAVCQNCSSQGRVCQGGTCQQPECNAATCPNGCCSNGVCVSGTQNGACGPAGGGACTDCSGSGQICRGRQCVAPCGPATCAGCCRSDNSCDTLGLTNNSCGQDGAACANCSATNSFCNGLVSPRRCNNTQDTCPAAYALCPLGVTMPVLQQLRNVCSDAELDTLVAACAGGPETGSCTAAVAALPGACQSCLEPFNHPFTDRAGLFACAASFVSNQCRRAMGCSVDCLESSCSQCDPTSADQCGALASATQCAPFIGNLGCAGSALSSGVCSQFSYPSYGAWLRGVGDRFCGNGP